ncbi:hypothetical protein TNCV_4859901 [Trichonephila clavipes]|nr:hypothetical protein TNCV_4859901 [Trichonephila clavipes]
MKKSAAEAHRMLSITYGEAAISERTYREWFQRFKNGDFDVEDQPAWHLVGSARRSVLREECNYLPFTEARSLRLMLCARAAPVANRQRRVHIAGPWRNGRVWSRQLLLNLLLAGSPRAAAHAQQPASSFSLLLLLGSGRTHAAIVDYLR